MRNGGYVFVLDSNNTHKANLDIIYEMEDSTIDISLDLSSKKTKKFIHAYIRRLLKQYTTERNKRKRLQQENAELRRRLEKTAELVEFAKRVIAVPKPPELNQICK